MVSPSLDTDPQTFFIITQLPSLISPNAHHHAQHATVLQMLLSASLGLWVSPPVMQTASVRAVPGIAPMAGGVMLTKKAPAAADVPILVQGGSLRTWSYRSPAIEQVQVVLSIEGRPLDDDIELWNGPDNTLTKMRVYVENGQLRPFNAVIETPRGPNTVAIRNIGQIEFPIAAAVFAGNTDNSSADCFSASMTIQGGALRTFHISIRSVSR